jgi:hypothetical protein
MCDIADIYDEFSYGQKTPQAIRDFLAATRRWQRPSRYVLLLGDASFDPKNHLGLGEGDLVPTKLIETRFLETASDDWLADFNGDGASDLAIGRLPARNAEEATRLIAKVLSHDQSRPVGEALFVSDSNDGFDFAAANAQLIRLLPPEVQAIEVKRGELDDQAARAQVLAALNRGPRLVTYSGHGSVTAWRGNLLMSGDARGLENQAHLSVFVMMDCLNGYFQDPASESLAESLLRGSTGGAVAVWASSALTFANQHMSISQEFYRQIFDKASGDVRIGDASRRAKGATRDEDVRRTWILLADPTMQIK